MLLFLVIEISTLLTYTGISKRSHCGLILFCICGSLKTSITDLFKSVFLLQKNNNYEKIIKTFLGVPHYQTL